MNRRRVLLTCLIATSAWIALPGSGWAQASGSLQVTARLLDVRPQTAALRRVATWLRADSGAARLPEMVGGPSLTVRRIDGPGNSLRVGRAGWSTASLPAPGSEDSDVLVTLAFLDN